jgi:16S rRNA (cytosine967-C5)-methyltransferase
LRVHRPVALQVLQSLDAVFTEGASPDKALERLFKRNRQLGARDRKFIAESTYDIIRNWRKLNWVFGEEVSPIGVERDEQIFWNVLAAWLVEHDTPSLPEWEEFRELSPQKIAEKLREARGLSGSGASVAGAVAINAMNANNENDASENNTEVDGENASIPLAIRESYPDWLDQLGREELGEKWDDYAHALNQPAPAFVRANRLKCDREKLAARLKEEAELESTPAPFTDDGLQLSERKNVFATKAFAEGWFEMQDGASQQVAQMVAPVRGERVIDACAGAGGKTLHLASLMGNKGKIISLDIYEWKLTELKRRCARAGVDIVEARLIEDAKTVKRLDSSADRVLLDVPCSGMGVVRRNPDTKWRLSLEELSRLRALQTEILDTYSTLVKPGGRLVYATCSCLPSENEKQVEAFLARNSNFTMVEEKKFAPNENGYDGFYAAALVRNP